MPPRSGAAAAAPSYPSAFGRSEPRHSFRQITSDYIVQSLQGALSTQDELKRGNTVLVVDDFALSVLNSAVSQNELLSAGFMTVCPFETKKQLEGGLRRRQYSNLDVLYFMRPKRSNLARVLEDYRQDVVEEKHDLMERIFPCIFGGLPEVVRDPAMYADCRLLLLPGMQSRPGVHNWQMAHDWLLGQVENRAKELERLVSAYKFDRQEVRDCVVEYMAYEASMFSLDLPNTLSIAYTHKLLASSTLEPDEVKSLKDRVFDHLDTVAQRLMTALVAINEYPYIRFTHSSRGISEVVATSLKKELKQYKDMHPAFAPWGSAQQREEGRGGGPPEPATVVVLDRADDLSPAVMHDLTYACVLTDLLDHEPATPFHYAYTKGGVRVEKDVLLDDSDAVWRALRYEELPVVMTATEEAYRQMRAKAEARRGLDPSDVRDLRELMSVLTSDEQQLEEKVSQHYRIKVQACEAYERRNLNDVRVMEQVLLTGCNDDGTHVDRRVIDSTLRELLRDANIESEDKARVLVCYLLCSKSIETRLWKELVALAALKGVHAEALAHLGDLHVPLHRSSSEARAEGAPFLDSDTLARNKKAALDTVARARRAAASAASASSSSSSSSAGGDDAQARLVRYVTKAEDIARRQLEGTLPEDAYPWVRQPPARGAAGAAGGGGVANGGGGGNGGGGSASGGVDPRSVSSSVALHGAHGEAVNKYMVSALTKADAASAAGGGGAGGKKGRFQSKFKGGGGGGGGGGDGSGAGSGAGGGAGGGGGGGAAGGGESSGDGSGDSAGAGALGRFMADPVGRPKSYLGGRLILFFVGGVTLSELAALERLAKESGREIIVGGTSILTARDFLEQLTLTDPDMGRGDDDGVGAGAGAGAMGAGVGDMVRGLDDFS